MIRGPKKPGGFTLLELLVVISIFVAMAAVVGASFNHVQRYRIKGEAQKLASLLRSARQYAVENGVHTRVVFADEAIEELTEGRLEAERAYGAYSFFKPVLPAGGSDYQTFADSGSEDGATIEIASLPFISIPSGFVGQFIPLPGSESWREIDPRVRMDAFVPEDADIEPGYSRLFFDNNNPLATLETTGGEASRRYVSEFYYNPVNFWDSEARAYYLPNIPNSAYPKNYFQTPYPRAYPLKASRMMPTEPAAPNALGISLTYREMWSDQAEYEFFHDIEDHTGDYKKLGLPDSDSDPPEDRRFFDLKGIEFSPKGLPTLTWADEVVFRFQRDADRPVPAYEVTLDRNTGLAHVRLARPQAQPAPAPTTAP